MNIGTILVTGCNGFLGKTILSQSLREGLKVLGTDISDASATPGIAYKKADITRPEELVDALGNLSTVIHAAGLAHVFTPTARSDDQFFLINEIGTENVAKAAAQAGAKRFILISSVSVYGPYTIGIYDENTPCHPIGPYALSKYHSELRAIEIASKSGMALTILRLATLYGEEDPGNVYRLMHMLDNGRFLWIGDGKNRKSLLYKGDAARAAIAVAARTATGVSVYNVSAPPCSMRDIVDGLAIALGKKPLPGRIPASVAMHASNAFSIFPYKGFSRLSTTLHKWLAEDVYDTKRIESDYGFHPQVSLIEGLKREVLWYRKC
jgi:nucleoside-diphosphate-sugar epimerase